jgi:cell division transport system ATP-binding protein
MLDFEGVSWRRRDLGPSLTDVSFTLMRGEVAVIRGGNGAGKTMLLRLAAALETPDRGRVQVAGQDIARLPRRALPVLRQSLGIVPQELLLLNDRSVLANVMLPSLAMGTGASEARSRARAALTRCGLDPDEAARLRPALLGGGDRQRAALARALVNRPSLLLADEPTAHLDAHHAAEVLRLLAQFSDAGVAVLVASRDERESWPARAHQWRLRDGRLQAAAPAVAA